MIGDEPQGTMGRVQTAGEARCLLPAFLCAHIFIKRETSGYEAGLTRNYIRSYAVSRERHVPTSFPGFSPTCPYGERENLGTKLTLCSGTSPYRPYKGVSPRMNGLHNYVVRTKFLSIKQFSFHDGSLNKYLLLYGEAK